MDLTNLDLRAKGVLLTLLFSCDEEGNVAINQSSFARENGLSRQEFRSILSKLSATKWITNSATNSGTNSTTNLTLNKSIAYKVLKTNKKPIQQPIQQPVQQPIQTTEKEPIDYRAFVEFFNHQVKGTSIPPIKALTEKRKVLLRARCKAYGKAVLAEAVKRAVKTPFLCGDNNQCWTATFDWIFTESNFVKIMEGNYSEQRNNKKAAQSSGRSQGAGATLEGVAREILRSCKD